jgi:hypothetical protein
MPPGRAVAHPLSRWVAAAWAAALVAVAVRLLVLPAGHRSVFPIFRHAGQAWLDQADLYPESQQGPGYPLFRYGPPVAAALVPFSALPTKPGDLIWRAINATALVGGFAWFLRTLPDRPPSPGQTAAAFALLLPAVPGGLGNAQGNALVIGLVLAGYAAAAERRFTVAAGALAAATLLKLYPAAPALLLVALHPRRLGPRYALALAAGCALPFALAEPDYVSRQYGLWVRYFRAEDRIGWPAEFSNIDLQLVVRHWVGPLTTEGYRLVEAVGGLVFLGLTLAAARRLGSADRAAPVAFGLGCVWMTTFGPATESPTYLMLTPATAVTTVRVWVQKPSDPVARVLATLGYALPLSLQLTLWNQSLSYAYRTAGPQPVAGLVLAAALIRTTWAGRPTAPGRPGRAPARPDVVAGTVPGEPA